VTGWWAKPEADVLAEVGSAPDGLTTDVARARGRGNRRLAHSRRSALRILAGQFAHPLVAMLLVAAAVSLAVGSLEDGAIILVIVAASGGLGFFQEYQAEDAVAKLRDLVKPRATVLRDGQPAEIDVDGVVRGDVLALKVGTCIPGDARVLTASGLQLDESALTGEPFPAEKAPAAVPADAPAARRASAVFLGTHVVSGTGTAVVVATGADTELGHVATRLESRRPPTDFAIGLHRFGLMLVQVTAVLVLGIFAVNVVLHRPPLESFLFSVALAVGLTPELLPAIVTVNLAAGARRMAAAGVVVKHLPSIENFGAVDVLCSDKTGTLTEGTIRLDAALDVDGQPSDRVRFLAWLNAHFESGYASPLDAAVREAYAGDAQGYERVDEVAYDFKRRRLSVAVQRGDERLLVTKGQLASVVSVCTSVERPDGTEAPLDKGARDALEALHVRLADQGQRLLGVAIRPVGAEVDVGSEDGMRLVGVLAFTDPPKPDVRRILDELDAMGVGVKVVTGDDRRVAAHLWRELRQREPVVLSGQDMRGLATAALEARAGGVDVFAEVEPDQKERIIHALRCKGHVVAYLGDGINDAGALHAADVGISVDSAADVAREAADIVLQQRDLAVLASGIREGRRTMARTLEYVRYTTSANFGNMLSMAFASLALPFLPLLPKQVLLNNLLSDVPAMAIASDSVDDAQLAKPGVWRTTDIRKFMLVFGAISTVFDLATFGVLLVLSHADEATFQAGWFVESLLTELFVLFVLRSTRPLGTDRPGMLLTGLTGGTALVAVALPYSPIGGLFGLVPMPMTLLGAMVGITVAYVAATEAAKRWFFRSAR
jgi:Mg2+-importing ATPase